VTEGQGGTARAEVALVPAAGQTVRSLLIGVRRAINGRMALDGTLRTGQPESQGTCCLDQVEGGAVMRHLLPWISVPLLLLGAAMLIAGIGAPSLWMTAVGAALVIISRVKPSAMGRW